MTHAENDEPVPFVDLGWQHARIADEVMHRFGSILERATFVKGPEVEEFEHAFARYTGAREVVGVGNGTDALELALRAVGVTAGDRVVLPANTFIATAEAVWRIDATPVLVDCDPTHLLIDVDRAVDAAKRSDARAVIAVDLFGQCAPLAELASRLPGHVALVEDAAQSQGARHRDAGIGGFASAAATSFYPGKNLGAYGDAGAVLTDSDELARWVRMTADHGSSVRYQHDLPGMNSRLDSLQAAVLLSKLAFLDEWNGLRAKAAERYSDLLRDIPGVVLPSVADDNTHVWHLFVVRVRDRDRVMQAVQRAGISVGIHYPRPVHLQPAFSFLGHDRGDFPVAERSADEMLSLPMYPGISDAQQQRVVDALTTAIS